MPPRGQNRKRDGSLLEDALAYTGLFAITGLIGGVILGDRLLRIYGEEFVEGTAALAVLISPCYCTPTRNS